MQHESQIPRLIHRLRLQEDIRAGASKPLLRDFLNALLPPTAQIQELAFKNSEQPGTGLAERKAIFDIYCESETGEKFIVELQKAK